MGSLPIVNNEGPVYLILTCWTNCVPAYVLQQKGVQDITILSLFITTRRLEWFTFKSPFTLQVHGQWSQVIDWKTLSYLTLYDDVRNVSLALSRLMKTAESTAESSAAWLCGRRKNRRWRGHRHRHQRAATLLRLSSSFIATKRVRFRGKWGKNIKLLLHILQERWKWK